MASKCKCSKFNIHVVWYDAAYNILHIDLCIFSKHYLNISMKLIQKVLRDSVTDSRHLIFMLVEII